METKEPKPPIVPRPPIPEGRKRLLATDYTVPEIAKVLKECDGYISITAPNLGVSERSLKSRIRRSTGLRELVPQLEKHWKDVAERTFIQTAVTTQHLGGMMYYLRTKGKTGENISADMPAPDGDVSDILNMIENIRRPDRAVEEKEGGEETSPQSKTETAEH